MFVVFVVVLPSKGTYVHVCITVPQGRLRTHYSAETTFFTNFFELTATRSNASVFDSKAWVDPLSSTI